MDIETYNRFAKKNALSYPQDIKKYVEFLFENRGNGVIVPRGEIDGSGWKPKLKDCHNNVDTLCKYRSEFKPARGWLFYDLGYEADYVMFQQHSVVVEESGSLIDITPNNAVDNYPFLYVKESDEQYFLKDKFLYNGNLFHIYR